MDSDGLRCQSQINEHFYEYSGPNKNYFDTEGQLIGFDGPPPDLTLLAPCEFCNRTFLPASLNKHKRGCYKDWLKVKERESRNESCTSRARGCSNDRSYNASGMDKPIITIEQMLAKRRNRRLNWRLRHEEFLRAVHAARDYAEAVATGNPLPPPPPPVVEPDLKECSYCHRKFHEKAHERHVARCKEQTIRSNREKPTYQTMEAKRRLAVRLYYQPNSRPNSCLSMTNPGCQTPTSFSRPSSRQTEFEYGRPLESPIGYPPSRHSSMSAIDQTDLKSRKKDSLINSLAQQYTNQKPGRRTPRAQSSQSIKQPNGSFYLNNLPRPESAQMSSRSSSMSMQSQLISGRQNLSRTPSIPKSRKPTNYVNIPNPGLIKRSTSCISQLNVNRDKYQSRTPTMNTPKGDVQSTNNFYCHKPFSCSKSPSVESLPKHKYHARSNSTTNTGSNEFIGSRYNSNISLNSKQLLSKVDKSTVRQKSLYSSKREYDNRKENSKQMESVQSNRHPHQHIHQHQHQHHYQRQEKSMLLENSQKSQPSPVIQESTTIEEQVQPRVRNEVQIKIKSNNISQLSQSSQKCQQLQIPQPNQESQPPQTSQHTQRHQHQTTPHKQQHHHHHHRHHSRSNKVKEPIILNDKLSKSNLSLIKEPIQSGDMPIMKISTPKIFLTSEIDSKDKTFTSIKSMSSQNKIENKGQGDNIVEIKPTILSTFGNENQNNGFKTNNVIKTVSTKVKPCRSIRSVAIADQNVSNSTVTSIRVPSNQSVTPQPPQLTSVSSSIIGTAKFKSTISLNETLGKTDEYKAKSSRKWDKSQFCHDCGHKFSGKDAKFCCSCGCKRHELKHIKS